MANYYEETMPLETNDDDYLQYFYDETIPLFQRLNSVIKRGEPFQRQALLSKLNLFQSKDIFKSLMEYILDDIQTWDKETITLFPKYLYNLLTEPRDILMQSIDNKLFNAIFKKIISIISSTEEQISREYMTYLEKIIIHFNNSEDKNSSNFPYVFEESIYDDIISLSKIDESLLNKQLSCCLCCSVIRLINDYKNEKVLGLFNRVTFLFTFCDKQIEAQLARELEFLIPIFKKDLLEDSNVSPSIYSYLNRDSDSALQTTTIISIVKNLNVIDYGELINKLVAKYKDLLFAEEVNFEQTNKNKIFFELIKSLEKNYKNIDINIIKKFFEDNFISDFIIKNKEERIIIENFDLIFFIYENMLNELKLINSDEIPKEDSKEESTIKIKMNYDDLFLGFYNHYLNINFTNTFYSQRKKIYNDNENIERKILYNNLMKIVPFLSDFRKNRNLYDKFNSLFDIDNIVFALDCYAENFNISSDDKTTKTNNDLYNLMIFFLKKNFEEQKPSSKPPNLKSHPPAIKDGVNHEGKYLKLFYSILSNILQSYNQNPKLFNNNIHLLLCDFFQKIIWQLYKYLKPTMREIDKLLSNNLLLGYGNRIKIKTLDKIYDDIFSNYLIKLANNRQIGNHVHNELIKIFPYLILYGKNRVGYFKYIQEHFIQSKTYFNRRYSVVFLDKCLEIFSFKMFNKIGLSDFLIPLINDENNAISANVINLIYIYNKKITKNSSIMFQNIIKNLSKINKDNKDNKLVHIEDFDIEKNRIINNILSLDFSNKNNTDKNNNEYWNNLENQLILEEKEIFGDDPYYGFHHLKGLVRSQTLNLNSQSFDIKGVNRKNNYLNNIMNKEIIPLKNKNKINPNKKSSTKDKYSSSVMINNYNNSSLKNVLPKIKPNRNSCINSISGKSIIRPIIKKLNNFKFKQENQKFHEITSKNNNSMILNEKSSIKTSYDFAKKGRSETKAIKVPRSIPPTFYPDLINSSNSISLKLENLYIDHNKIKLEKKNKDNLFNTIYKSKNIHHLEYNSKNNKTLKLKKDTLKESSIRYNKILNKINSDSDKLNSTNASIKEKSGQSKWYMK